ncbi:MAG: hypothetical protein LBL66_06450, partial [Clostridiales bacterium]|nr:hypothetical protein [Clostridiales bacterium]
LSTLQQGKVYGTAAIKIYDECCASFGWDRSQRGKFAQQRRLFAVAADADRKRNIWFICHSNWTKEHGKGGKINTIKDNRDTVEVKFIYPIAEPQACDLNDTVVFAKRKDGFYEFLGVYKMTGITPGRMETRNQIETYKRIGSVWPI